MYLIHFSPIDGPFCKYQYFDPEALENQIPTVESLLDERYGPPQLDTGGAGGVYVVDAESYAIFAESKEIGQARLMSNWLNHLVARLEDGGDWFSVGENIGEQFYSGLLMMFHRGCATLLHHAESNWNLVEELDLTDD